MDFMIIDNAHSKNREILLKELKVDTKLGLTGLEVEKRQKQYGLNELTKEKTRSLFQKLLDQLGDFLVLILVFAAFISCLMGEFFDAGLIVSIVALNALFGLVQESKADKALEALKEMGVPKAQVLRNGVRELVHRNDLVLGDIVFLEAGDSVPADLRLIETINLEIQESALTGESLPITKNAETIVSESTSLAERANMAYLNTIITYGRGIGVVIATGNKTEIGKIAKVISSFDASLTPLQIKLDSLSKKLGIGVLIICAIVFLTGFLRGLDSTIHLLLTAISLAVAAVPEGLPAVVTIILALGMTRMSKKNAVIRKLLAVETLGTTTVICSDKTGTLTQNQMTVTEIILPNGKLRVSGTGYEPQGGFEVLKGSKTGLSELLAASVLCNDSILTKKDRYYDILGDPTEGALIVAAAKYNLTKTDLDKRYPRVLELPFDSTRKRMSTLHKYPNGYRLYVKGAPDEILKYCSYIYVDGKKVPLTSNTRYHFYKEIERMSDQALRVLGFAFNDFSYKPTKLKPSDESNLVFIGLMGMFDPPRKETKEAIKKCKLAGIRPIMITGDYARTALAIGRLIGLTNKNNTVLKGDDIDRLSQTQLCEAVDTVDIFARVTPEHKVKIVEALKNNGHIVAMTGDGINDAMAIKKSDIGIAMGISGTDVAKQTSDMVLVDDNFASIVNAINEGRVIYANIKKVVYFLLSCNLAEVFVIFTSMLFGLPIPLNPVHLLWINLITDALPAIALGIEPGEKDVMLKKPRNPKEPILDHKTWFFVIMQASVLTLATIMAFLIGLHSYGSLPLARTMAFFTMILGELLRAFSCRSETASIFMIKLFSNPMMIYSTVISFLVTIPLVTFPPLSKAFSIVPLTKTQWLLIFGLGTVPFLFGELIKLPVILNQKARRFYFGKQQVVRSKL